MISSERAFRRKQRGYSIMGLLSALLVVTILVAVVGVIVYFFYTSSRTTSMEGALKEVRAAVSVFVTESSEWPTLDGKLPPDGEDAPINFSAGFTDNTGKTVRFYPHFLKDLPRHWNSGVWLIDSRGDVSVDLGPGEY